MPTTKMSISVPIKHLNASVGEHIMGSPRTLNEVFTTRGQPVYKLWNIIYESKNYLDDEDVDIFLEIIKEISMLTKNNNSKLIIAYEQSDMIINSLKESSKYSNESIINEFINYADKAVNVTLAETLEKRPRKYYIHELDMHVTAEANIERAKIIAETINKLSEKN